MPGQTPRDPGEKDTDAARLEAALDRIARATERRPAALPADRAELAARLDRLIAELRRLLGT
jgi:hypothetical protein